MPPCSLLCPLLLFLLAASLTPSLHAQQKKQPTAQPQNAVFSYYYYSETGVKPWEIPGSNITHLLWAFANIYRDGQVSFEGPPNSAKDYLFGATKREFRNVPAGCDCQGTCLKGEMYQLYLLRQKFPHLKIILSVGGWEWSHNFSVALSSRENRRRTIDTSVNLIKQYGFDGLDIDYEFPNYPRPESTWTTSPNDYTNLALLLEEFKSNSNWNKDWSLSVAMIGQKTGDKAGEVGRIAKAVDYVLLMAYEFHHNNRKTRLSAGLFPAPADTPEEKAATVESCVNAYIQAGTSPSQLVLDTRITAAVPYNTLIRLTDSSGNSGKQWTYAYDDVRKAAILSNGTTMYSFDDVRSVKDKVKWVGEKGLAGVMLWNSNQDTLSPATSLHLSISTVYPVSTSTTKTPKDYCFKTSDYCNLLCDYKIKELNVTNGGGTDEGRGWTEVTGISSDSANYESTIWSLISLLVIQITLMYSI
ncbi:glycoside hydrolase superfamily [Paraphysoderma sedebokerense]|nr:glycoside hydrolase superfamily [Paraphysoderma sedebokerense]